MGQFAYIVAEYATPLPKDPSGKRVVEHEKNLPSVREIQSPIVLSIRGISAGADVLAAAFVARSRFRDVRVALFVNGVIADT